MTLRICLREFSRSPWRGLFLAAGAGFGLALWLERSAVLPDLCGGDWSRALAERGLSYMMDLAALTISPSMLAVEWAVMLLAMMPPLLAQPLAHLRRALPSRRRARAIVAFLLGYGLVWMAAGPALVAAALICGALLPGSAAPLFILCAALVWTASPWSRKALNRGHFLARLRIFGWRADLDALRYGLVHGGWCVAACWPWMCLPLAAGAQHAPVMAAVCAVLLMERLAPPSAPRWRAPAFLRVAADLAASLSGRGARGHV